MSTTQTLRRTVRADQRSVKSITQTDAPITYTCISLLTMLD